MNRSTISTTRNLACMYAHMRMPVRTAEIWKKLFPESIFINKLRWLINILHYTVVLVLVNPLSFYWLGGVKWNRMWSHRPWLRLLTKPTPILSGSICSSHNVVGLSCVRNMHSLASLQRYEESANSFTKDYDRGEIELSCSLLLSRPFLVKVLPNNKAYGLYSCPVSILKLSSHIISQPLAQIF